MKRTLKRWVVTTDAFMLGKYYWEDATEDELEIRTFRTRAQARDAAKQAGLKKLRVASAIVTIETK